ncbi:MAG TPA: N-6 DNA methylase [Pirellulales bacterium]|nr:N-6 DNA methylase [Pirellulales bacterium]
MEAAFSVFRKIQSVPEVAVHGQVATKPHIVDLMLDLAGYHGDASKTFLDPGCGQGAFTVAASRRLVRASGIPSSVRAIAGCILGIEKDEAAAAVCRERLIEALVDEGVSPRIADLLAQRWVIVGDFLGRCFDRTFDFVVGNPPYVRQEAIPKRDLERYRAELDCFYDRADLYVAFFEKSLKLLSIRGRLAFICPDRFARNKYGKKLRALISSDYAVESVLDLAQASPFEPSVICYPGIFVMSRTSGAGRRGPVDHFRLTEANAHECDVVRQKKSNGAVVYHQYDMWFSGDQQWSVESPEHLRLLRRLEAENAPLGDEASGCRVGIGVATGADDVFIVDRGFDEVESELLMPLVTTRDVASGEVRWLGQSVINPFVSGSQRLIDLDQFPKARAYFQQHRHRLTMRNVAQRDTTRWYRTIDRIYPDLRLRPKLLIPDIKAENLIVLEEGRLYPHHNLYYVASDYWDLAALRTILRSSLGKFFVWMYGVKMRGDFLRFQAQYLRRICVPHLLSLSKRAIGRLKAVDGSADQEEIDRVVAEVYDLNQRESALLRAVAEPRRQT